MAVTAYLQQFLNEISKLPENVRSSLDEILKLEEINVFEDDTIEVTELLEKIDNSTIDRMELEALEQLKQRLTKNLSCASKKIDIINKLYNLVDQEVTRLDKDIKHFESETSASNFDTKSQDISPSIWSPVDQLKQSNDTSLTVKPQDIPQNNNLEVDLTSGINMPVDPNEPTYCLCQQVSYGNMVMCDNKNCPYEWFHFGCVGLVEQPAGKWYCAKCKTLKKRPSSRKRR